jgi:hypothetical protein
MGEHLIDGEFQSDKYPTTPRGKVPLSTKDPTAQDLLAEYARRRRAVDAAFSDDLKEALRLKGYVPAPAAGGSALSEAELVEIVRRVMAAGGILDEETIAKGRDFIRAFFDALPRDVKLLRRYAGVAMVSHALAADSTARRPLGMAAMFAEMWDAAPPGLAPEAGS